MRCEKCHGMGIIVVLKPDPKKRFMLRDTMHSAPERCEACGGSGIAHCCDGECAAPEQAEHSEAVSERRKEDAPEKPA